jgi:hypothetical protein
MDLSTSHRRLDPASQVTFVPREGMELLTQVVQFVLHPDVQLAVLLRDYGTWIYRILFAVIFCETGNVFSRSASAAHYCGWAC